MANCNSYVSECRFIIWRSSLGKQWEMKKLALLFASSLLLGVDVECSNIDDISSEDFMSTVVMMKLTSTSVNQVTELPICYLMIPLWVYHLHQLIPKMLLFTNPPKKEILEHFDSSKIVWKKKHLSSVPLEFSETPLPETILNLQAPYQFFKYFFTNKLVSHIANETNYYATLLTLESNISFSDSDVSKYVGILLLTSVIQLSNIRKYWSSNVGIRTVVEAIPVNYFEKIKDICISKEMIFKYIIRKTLILISSINCGQF